MHCTAVLLNMDISVTLYSCTCIISFAFYLYFFHVLVYCYYNFLPYTMQMQRCCKQPATSELHHLKETLSPAEIYAEHKYLGLSLKVHSPKEIAGFINEPAEIFLSYIPVDVVLACGILILMFTKANKTCHFKKS